MKYIYCRICGLTAPAGDFEDITTWGPCELCGELAWQTTEPESILSKQEILTDQMEKINPEE